MKYVILTLTLCSFNLLYGQSANISSQNSTQKVEANTSTSESLTTENESAEATTVAGAVKQKHAEFMKGFVKSLGSNDYVIYKKEKLILLARYSNRRTAVLGVLSALLGLLALTVNANGDNRDFEIKVLFNLFAGGSLLATIYRIAQHFNTEIFLILDEKGIIKDRKHVVKWNDVKKVNLLEHPTFQKAELFNEYGSKVITIETDTLETMPMTFEEFKVVLKHYWETFGSKAEAQTI